MNRFRKRTRAVLVRAVCIGVLGFVGAVIATSLGIGLAQGQGGLLGLAAGHLADGLSGSFVAFSAAMGAPVSWRLPEFGNAGGHVQLLELFSGQPLLLAATLLCPLFVSLSMGWRTAASARRAGIPRAVLTLATSVVFAAVVAGAVAIASAIVPDGGLIVKANALAVFGVALAWAGLFGLLGSRLQALRAGRRTGARPVLRRSRTALVATLAVFLVPVAGPAAAATSGTTSGSGPRHARPSPLGYKRPGVDAALAALRQESSANFAASNNSRRGTPSIVLTDSPMRSGVQPWLRAHAGLFGTPDPTATLRQVAAERDALGYQHVRFEQTVRGVPVYQGAVTVHVDPGGRVVRAITNAFRPDVGVGSTSPI